MAGADPKDAGDPRDMVAFCIAAAAVVLFTVTGAGVGPLVLRKALGHGPGPDPLVVSALLLNIALVLLGWRRLSGLQTAVQLSREAEAEARSLAETDPLTGCLNRRSATIAASNLLSAASERHQAVAVAMLDLDNFKRVNDMYGHQAGDAMLCMAAERLRTILPDLSLLARLGGDEFACLWAFDPRASGQIDRIAERIIDSLGQPISWDGLEIEASVSIGLSNSDRDGTDVQVLLHKADIAMFQSKRLGRNRFAWFAPEMAGELRFRSELEAGIRRGIAAGEFVPFYEKQIDLATGELVGFEMLARWISPKLGRLGPDIFIPVAEEIGVIAELSESLIRQALRDAREWDPALTLAVNISPVQLRDPWFAQKLLRLLVEANFPPHRLEIEITESNLHDNLGLVRAMMASLKNQGIRVSLDDFGTGYSSLTQLRNLPFDRIKIDRSFVTSLPESEESRAIVRSIIALGQGLGLPVTAEGVETADVLAALADFDGLKAQGYLYGHPAPAEPTLAELRERERGRTRPRTGTA